jgi:hypothetical protein
MGIRSMIDRVLGRPAPESEEPPPALDGGESERENAETIEERLDEVRENQTFYMP